jgi:hypothetical protein
MTVFRPILSSVRSKIDALAEQLAKVEGHPVSLTGVVIKAVNELYDRMFPGDKP